MYKKVYHHITEEHFHHPHGVKIAEEIVASLDRKKPKNPSNIIPLTHSAQTFTNTVTSNFGYLSGRLRHYVISAAAGLDDLMYAKNKIAEDIQIVSSLVIPYYGTDFANTLQNALQQYADAICNEVSAVKNNAVTPALKMATSNAIENLASTLGNADPVDWPKGSLSRIAKFVADGLVEEAVARKNKDWQKDLILTDDIYSTIVNPRKGGQPSLSNIFAQGVINKFPDQFKE
jgi:hypothetical protein